MEPEYLTSTVLLFLNNLIENISDTWQVSIQMVVVINGDKCCDLDTRGTMEIYGRAPTRFWWQGKLPGGAF